MPAITVAVAARAGITITTATVVPTDTLVETGGTACDVGGDSFANSGQELAIFTNGSGAPITLTFVSQNTVDGRAVADRTVSILAGATVAYGPFPIGIYNDASGLVQMTYSAVTTLNVKVVKVTPA